MPTVPGYEQQVEAKPLPGFRQESVATPALLGGAADSAAAASKGMSDIGIGGAAVAHYMQERDDATAVLAVETARKEKQIAFEAQAAQDWQGANAPGATKKTKEWWDAAAKEDFTALTTDSQRELYKRRMSPHALQSVASMSKFENHQADATLLANTKAAGAAAVAGAAAKPTDVTNLALQKSNGLTSIAAYAKIKGLDQKGPNGEPSAADQMRAEFLTHFHKEVIQALPPELQRDYFTANEQEIAGDQRDVIGKAARRETADAIGQKAATEVITKFGYGLGVDALATKLRDQFGTDTVTLKAAVASLKEQVGEFEHGEKTRVESAASKVNTALINGAAWGQVQRSLEYRALLTDNGPAGVKMAGQIQDHQESLAATRASRAASESNRRYTDAAHKQLDLAHEGLAKFTDLLMNPEKVAAMTPAQVINLRTEIGDANMQHVAQQHAALSRSAEAVTAARISTDLFTGLAVAAGLQPHAKDQTDDQKKLATLKMAVDMRLSAEAKLAGKALTFEQAAKIAKEAFDDKIREPGFWSGTLLGRTTPVAALTTEQRQTSLAKEMPKAFEVEASAALRARGQAPTPALLLEAWAASRKTWKPAPEQSPRDRRGY